MKKDEIVEKLSSLFSLYKPFREKFNLNYFICSNVDEVDSVLLTLSYDGKIKFYKRIRLNHIREIEIEEALALVDEATQEKIIYNLDFLNDLG